MKTIAVSALWLMLVSFAVSAQDDATGKNEVSVWGGFSPAIRTFDTAGRTWDATLGIGAIRYSRRFNSRSWIDFKYTLDGSVVIMNYPDKVVTGTVVTPTRETPVGIGVAPIGLQGNFRPRKKLQPFLAMSLGGLAFTETTPNVTGAKLNFTVEGGGGIEYRLKNRKAITFGYKFYHISNAYRAVENPGYDAQIFYVGYTFFSR